MAAVSAAASAAAASFAALASTVSFAVSRRLPSWLPLLPKLTRSQLLLQPLWLLHPLLPWLQLPILLYLLGCLLGCLCCCSISCKHVVLLGGCFGLGLCRMTLLFSGCGSVLCLSSWECCKTLSLSQGFKLCCASGPACLQLMLQFGNFRRHAGRAVNFTDARCFVARSSAFCTFSSFSSKDDSSCSTLSLA